MFFDVVFSLGLLKGFYGCFDMILGIGGLMCVGVIWGVDILGKMVLFIIVNEVVFMYDIDESLIVVIIEMFCG